MKDLIDHVKDNCTEIDREARFDDFLNEHFSFRTVGGPFDHMVPSQVLKEMDPTAYRCGVNDYMDGEDTYEIDGETYDRKEVEEARDEFVEELELELSALEDDLSEVEEDDQDTFDQLQTEITDIERRIQEAKDYQF
jgi:hypothetical protein